jgi:hypothetical protein
MTESAPGGPGPGNAKRGPGPAQAAARAAAASSASTGPAELATFFKFTTVTSRVLPVAVRANLAVAASVKN